eukprot:855603-Pleurochrysis_carterae.AAC.3
MQQEEAKGRARCGGQGGRAGREIAALHLRLAAANAVQSAASEALARQAAVPVLHAKRAEGKTKDGKVLPFAMRVLAYAAVLRAELPLDLSFSNIVAAVRCVPPHVECS